MGIYEYIKGKIKEAKEKTEEKRKQKEAEEK